MFQNLVTNKENTIEKYISDKAMALTFFFACAFVVVVIVGCGT